MTIEDKIKKFLSESDTSIKGIYKIDENGTLKLIKTNVGKEVENIVISSSEFRVSDIKTIFDTDVVYLTDTIDIPTLLVEIGVYKSKGIAKDAGRVGVLEDGYSEIKASKIRRICIWNPRTRKSIKEYMKNKEK